MNLVQGRLNRGRARRFVACGLVATAAVAGTAGAAGASAAPQAHKASSTLVLNMAAPQVVQPAALLLAQQAGILKKYGVVIHLTFEQSGAVIVPALLNGSLNAAYLSIGVASTASSQGLPLEVISGFDQAGSNGSNDQSKIITKAGSGITSLTQLVGKTIGINQLNSFGEAVTLGLLQKAGISDPQSKVTFVAVPSAEEAASLASGQIQAAFIQEPYWTEARNTTSITTIVTDPEAQMINDMPLGTITMTQAFAKAHAAQLPRLHEALAAAAAYATAHTELVRGEAAGAIGLPESTASKIVVSPFSTVLSLKAVQAEQNLLHEFGVLPTLPNDSVLFSPAAFKPAPTATTPKKKKK